MGFAVDLSGLTIRGSAARPPATVWDTFGVQIARFVTAMVIAGVVYISVNMKASK